MPRDARHKRIDALGRNLVGCTVGTVATDEFRRDPRTNHLLPVESSILSMMEVGLD
jgi:hypothetical protein